MTLLAGSLSTIGGRPTAVKGTGTRDAILNAAVELGSLRGLEELSMGGLASTVDMSKSGLFAHFGSKEELQLATVTRAWAIFESEVGPERGRRGNGALEDLLERWLSFFERRIFPGGCFFVISAVEFAALEGPVRTALAEALERQTLALEAAVRAANESGELRTWKDPRETAFALHSILVNANSFFIVHGDPRVFDHARATMGDLLGEPRRSGKASLVRQG